jgi:hypothetical protein
MFGSVAQLPNMLAAITGAIAITALVSRENAGLAKLGIPITLIRSISDNSPNEE